MIYLTSLPDYNNNFNVNGNTIVSENLFKKYYRKNRDVLLDLTGSSKIQTRLKKILFYSIVFFLKNKNKQSIYTTLDDNYGFYLQILLLKFLSFFYKKIIIHHHSFTYINKKNNLFKLLSSDKFIHISISEKQNQVLKKNYRIKNIYFIKNNALVYDNLFFKKKKNKKLKVIYFSALTKEKGIYDFLNLSKNFLNNNINFQIYGNNCKQDVLNDIKRFKKNKFINKYQFNIYNKRKVSIFRESDILLFPSSYKSETTPMVIDECINFQVIPISYDIGDIKNQLENTNLIAKNFISLQKKLIHVTFNHIKYKQKIIRLKKKKLKLIKKQKENLDKIFLI